MRPISSTESPTDDESQLAKRINESLIIAAIGRLMLVAVLPISIAIGGWMVQRLVSSVDVLAQDVTSIRLDLVAVKKDIEFLKDAR